MFVVFMGGVVLGDPPLTSVQILWVNLIMDTFAASALATEPPSEKLLDDMPYKRTEKIVTACMWRNILGQGVYQAIILCVLLFRGKELFGIDYPAEQEFFDANGDPTKKNLHFTLIFNIFVFLQVFNIINARKLGEREWNVFSGFFNNWLFLMIFAVMVVVQILMVQYGGRPVRAHPLNMEQHYLSIGIGAGCLIWALFVKLIPASLCQCFAMNEEVMTDEEEAQSFTANMRRSFRQSHGKGETKV